MVPIESGLRRVAEAVGERLPELYDEIRNRLQAETPDYSLAGNEQLSSAESATITASLRDVLDYISDAATTSIRASNEALREVRLAARAGVSLQLLLRGSRLAQAATWDFILEEAHRLLPDAGERVAVLRLASAHHFAWNASVSDAIIAAFEQESTVYALQSRERRKMSTLNALLAGLPVDTTELEYTFDGLHLAALVWGAAPDTVANAIRGTLGIRPLTAVQTSGEGLLWLPWSARLGPPQARIEAVELPQNCRLAFGALGSGLEGFRTSHRQAVDARSVILATDAEVGWYDDLVLEALAMHDLVAMRAFVLDELRDLGDVFDAGNVLIDTLRVYFAAGENAVITAQRLGVHSRTVAYRLRQIESRIGADALHREELAIALRLAALVTATGPTDNVPDPSPGLSVPAV